MLSEKEILAYLFKHTHLQKKIIPEIQTYIKDKLNKKIINIFNKIEILPITYIDYNFLIKEDKELSEYVNQIFKENLLEISNELYLKEITFQLKKDKYLSLRKKIDNNNESIIENIEKEVRIIKNFNLLDNTDFVDMKDLEKLKELNTKEISEGFFTGFEQLDHYVKSCGGFLKGSFTTIVAPPHTGKCVVKDTKITIKINEEIKIINIKDLLKYTKKIKKIKDEKFTLVGDIDNIEVWTNTGFKYIEKILETKPYDIYEVVTDNIDINSNLKCADEHIVATLEGLKTIKELVPYKSTLITKKLYSLVIEINKLEKKEPMYDLQLKEELYSFKNKDKLEYKIGDYLQHKELKYELYEIKEIDKDIITIDLNNHLYYTNDILSHNTLFLTTIASKAIIKKKNILYFSFEMPEIQILKRIFVNIFDKKMKSINYEMDEVYMTLDAMQNDLGNMLIKEYPSSTCTPDMIENILEKMYEEHQIDNKNFFPDILFIDQLTTLGSQMQRGSSLYEKGKEGIEQLKAIGQKYNLIVFAGAQANRATLKSDNGVQMDNVAESWGIPQITDMGFGAIKEESSITATNPFVYNLLITCFKNRLGGNLENSNWQVDTQKMNFIKRKL